MTKVAVSRIAALCGKHHFKSRKDAIQELFWKCSTYKPNPKLLDVKTDLFNSSFHNWYCQSREITSKMRIIGRSIIVKTCKKYGVKFNRPFSYFCKERGIYREEFHTNQASLLLKTKVFNRQRRIEKKYKGFKVCGAIDGETDSHVVEIKTRSSPITVPPIWEIIQLAWYSYILQKPGYLFSFHNGTFKRKEIKLDQATEIVEQTLEELNKLFNSSDLSSEPCT